MHIVRCSPGHAGWNTFVYCSMADGTDDTRVSASLALLNVKMIPISLLFELAYNAVRSAQGFVFCCCGFPTVSVMELSAIFEVTAKESGVSSTQICCRNSWHSMTRVLGR